ncbi:MAG: hypothetical protein K6A33_12460, partial [Clostridiales bacterium]|nr:hypothetical protein [Clostridiales bacterium]
FGNKTDLTVKVGEDTLLPLSMLKSPFKYARDLYREEYEWVRDHSSEKYSIAELTERFAAAGIKVRLIKEKNLLIIQ